MRLSIVMAVMYVMGRLGVWEPYLRFVEMILNVLDRVCEEEFGLPWQEEMYNMEAELDG